jgi:hypothetical protein
MNPLIPEPSSLFPQGTREFKTRGGAWLTYIMGGCFGSIGLVALLVSIVGIAMGGGLDLALPCFIGILFFLVGVGIPVAAYFFGKNYSISCRPDGFTVKTENKRKGTEQKEYRWEDVTSTDYQEFRSARSRSSRNRSSSRTVQTFIVETTQGQAFKVGPQIGDFRGLIALFNAMTPQLPYTWEPQTGFSINLGPLSAGRSAYVATPRTTPPPQAQPPPVPPPTPPPVPPQ